MSNESYSLHVHPGCLSEEDIVQTISATKRTTAAEVINVAVSRLGVNDGLSYVLVELHSNKGEEMVLASSDHPVQRMLLWPLQYQHSYKFLLRQTDKDGTILYSNAPNWQAKVEKESTQRDMAQKGFLPPTEPSKQDYPDLCTLSNLTQDKILEVLKMRFEKDKIYTYTASTLISINPYKFLPIYNPKFMTIYQNRKKEDLAPHIYAVADAAFTKMVETSQHQCIVITGKSGSGKTQATHFLVHHTLALCQKSYMTGVEHMLIGCGPILEAFGNAQTEHNYNSSRFGKFLRIYFYDSGLLSGADIRTYLLEKSRLVHQEPNERNFHIFYYLLCGATDDELHELHLDRNMMFEYINKGNMIEQHEASSELNRLRQAMEVIGFFKGAQKNMFKLIAAILLLGNITFKVKKGRDEALEIEDESYLMSVCSLLALEPALVRKCLLTRKAKAGAGERFVLDLKLNEAKATRDAMAKALYQNLFEWTVNSVNMALAQRTRDNKLRSQSRWIGLLDIFGFEDFVKNGFEQFCINYASEHLQHYCIKHTFQLEQEQYRQEGLSWKEIEYADNSGCLDLYEKKPMGLFYLMEENYPGANNQTLLAQFNRVHSPNPYFDSPVVKEDAFLIEHYAGKVKYQIKDFREKNHDQVREDIITVLRATRSSFIQEVISKSPAALFRWSILRAVVRAMFAFRSAPGQVNDQKLHHDLWRHKDLDGKQIQAAYVHKKMMARLSQPRTNSASTTSYSTRNEGGSLHGKKKPTVSRAKKKIISISQQYQASMASLLNALEKAAPYFVRCIQPNNQKIPQKIDENFVLHQLRCSGTLQTIKLEQSRYPERLTTDQFFDQYKLLFPKSKRVLTLEEIEKFLLSFDLETKTHFQIGRSMVFLRHPAFHALQDELHKVVCRHVVYVQTRTRGWIARRLFVQQKAAAVKIQSFWRMVECQREIEDWHDSAAIIQYAWRSYQRRKLLSWFIPFQAHCRGYLTRQLLKKRRERLNLKATVIQRSWRRYKLDGEQKLAAIAIQTWYRGYAARKEFESKKQELAVLKFEKEENARKFVKEIRLDDSPVKDSLGKERETKKTVEEIPFIDSPIEDSRCAVQLSNDDTVSMKTDASFSDSEKAFEHDRKTQAPSSLGLINSGDFDSNVFRDNDASMTSHGKHRDKIQKTNLQKFPNNVGNRSKHFSKGGDFSPTSTHATRLEAMRSRKIVNGSPSKSGDHLFSGDIFMNSAFSSVENRNAALSNWGKSPTISEKDRRFSDSDMSEIIPSPTTSSSRDSLEEKPQVPSDFIYTDSKPPAGAVLGAKKGSHTSMSYPALPRVDKASRFADKVSPTYEENGKKETHFPADFDLSDSSKTYTETTFSADDRSFFAKRRTKNGDLARQTKDKLIARKEEMDRQSRNLDDHMKQARHISSLRTKTAEEHRDNSLPGKNDAGSRHNEAINNSAKVQLEREWIAFQKMEHERQFRELNKRVHSSPHRETKEERKLREETTSLRLEQMSLLKEKMEKMGVTADAMPDVQFMSRNASEKSDAGIPSPPITPTSPPGFVHSIPEHQEVSGQIKNQTLTRSSSMENLVRSKSKKKPRRQRSNSAVEMYIDMKAPSTDPITRKASSLNAVNAAAFAKKCMEEEKLSKQAGEESASSEKLEMVTSQPENKRGSAFIQVVKKRFRQKNTRHHPPLSSKKSSDSLLSTGSILSSDRASLPDDSPPVEVKVRATVAEEFSPKLLISKADEILLLESFIKDKMTTFKDSNLVDQVFKSALDEFCHNLTAFYSLTMLSKSTNGLRYKDVVNNFRQVLEKNATKFSLDQYAASMAVNGFRGYMSDYMKNILPKHTAKEAKTKRKKNKDDTTEVLGHRFTSVQWGITQVCEYCEGTMWLMESGLMCKVCKYACHKKCKNKLTTKCPGAPSSGKAKSKPKKLFGESLISLEGDERLLISIYQILFSRINQMLHVSPPHRHLVSCLVPVFVDKCISYMEANGIYQEGVYRRSAAATQIKQLAEALNKDIECQKINFDDYNIHSVASCFKKFLRTLPDPLVPHDKYFDFLQASKLDIEREKITSLFCVLDEVPEHNHATLERIIFHLARVAQQEPTNRMSPSNLAIVFTPCFFAPPPHVSPVSAAEHIGVMTRGIELIITEQMKKIKRTLENISELDHVENSTNERLKQIRQSMGKGKKKRIRPSFREGPRSPSHRRSLLERRSSLGAVEEDADLARKEEEYEQRMATLRSRKESLTSRLPALVPQISVEERESKFVEGGSSPYSVLNQHLRHYNKNRVSALPQRRRPSRYADSRYAPRSQPQPEVKPIRKVTQAKGRLKRLTSSSFSETGDSFMRTSQLRNPIHPPRRKKTSSILSSPTMFARELKFGKSKGTAV